MHPADQFAPVRLAAGALGGGYSHRDLVQAADPALNPDCLALYAEALVKGITITCVRATDPSGRGAHDYGQARHICRKC